MLVLQALDLGIGPLRSRTHVVGVRVAKNAAGTDVLIATLDGDQIFQHTEPVLNQWRTVHLAFTAATSQLTDTQQVRDVAITANR